MNRSSIMRCLFVLILFLLTLSLSPGSSLARIIGKAGHSKITPAAACSQKPRHALSSPQRAGQFTFYNVRDQYGLNNPFDITLGPDGNLWFTDPGYYNNYAIGRITPNGIVTKFSIPDHFGYYPLGITTGPDGNLWYTNNTLNYVGRLTITSVGDIVTEFPIPASNSQPDRITTGLDGNLWFTENNASNIGRITPQGQITEFPVPNGGQQDITAGPDGNLWFTQTGYIGRITPGGSVTEFPVGGTESGSGITAGPDGNLWFTEWGAFQIGMITPSGNVTLFQQSTTENPVYITAGPDSNLWFTENSFDCQESDAAIGRITPKGRLTEFPLGGAYPLGITSDHGHFVWFASNYYTIGKVTTR